MELKKNSSQPLEAAGGEAAAEGPAITSCMVGGQVTFRLLAPLQERDRNLFLLKNEDDSSHISCEA